eukprot:2773031-Lingulodinium_polyedra.AAC.1
MASRRPRQAAWQPRHRPASEPSAVAGCGRAAMLHGAQRPQQLRCAASTGTACLRPGCETPSPAPGGRPAAELVAGPPAATR